MRTYTIWLFVSLSSGERVIAARTSHGDDSRYQHEYQRILGHVGAWSETKALTEWTGATRV